MSKIPAADNAVGKIEDEIEKEIRYSVNDIPKPVYEELARCFLPDIIAFFESEEGKREYENWKKENNLS